MNMLTSSFPIKTFSYTRDCLKNGTKIPEQALDVSVVRIPAVFGSISHINMFSGENIVTVFISGGHFLNWTVVFQAVDDKHEIIQGPHFNANHKENCELLHKAIEKFTGSQVWELVKGEFSD